MEHRPKVVGDIAFTCVVWHNMLRTHQVCADRAPITANDIMTSDNYKNPPKEAKHQLDLLKNYFNHVGKLTGYEDRI